MCCPGVGTLLWSPGFLSVPGSAVQEFLSASTCELSRGTSNAHSGFFLRTISPGSSVMALPLMVLSKPSSTGCAMACAMSPQLAQALLDQGSSLCVCSHQSPCAGFLCSQSGFVSMSKICLCFPPHATLCGHCPFPLWWPCREQGAVPAGVCI